MKNLQLIPVSATEFGIEEVKATQVFNAFTLKVEERNSLLEQYSEITKQEITPELVKQADDLRKKLVKSRTAISAIHKAEKDFYLASGKFIDAIKNKLTLPITQAEEKLEEVSKYYENLEKERIAKLKAERVEILEPFRDFIPFGIDLGIISNEDFEKIPSGAKLQLEAKEKADFEAEQERLKQIEIERVEKEKQQLLYNRKLLIAPFVQFINEQPEIAEMSEIEFNTFKTSLEKAKANFDSEQKEKLRIAQEEAEKQRIEREKAEAEAKLAKELANKKAVEEANKIAELQRQLETKEKAEAEAKLQLEIEQQNKLKAPDKEKLLQLAKTFNTVEMPILQTESGVKILGNINILVSKLNNYILEQADKIK